MKLLIVYAHPSRKSYTYEILEQLILELTSENHTVELSDLYKMNFLSDMTEAEYQREGSKNFELPIPDDIKAEHKKIDNADGVIFLYPVWWSDCPAKLKGWFDRVWSVGYAYYQDAAPAEIQKMASKKLGHVVCTAGYTNGQLTESGIGESMCSVMLNDRLGDRFEVKGMTILGGTLNLEQVRREHSGVLREIASSITR